MSKQMDRRYRKTRDTLCQCFISLAKTKEIKNITVKELTDLSDINRGTFYLHYEDIYDFIDELEKEILDQLDSVLTRVKTSEALENDFPDILLNLFSALYQNLEITRTLLGPHGDLNFMRILKEKLGECLSLQLATFSEQKDFSFLYSFILYGFTGILENWIYSPAPVSPNEIADFCAHLTREYVTPMLHTHSASSPS